MMAAVELRACIRCVPQVPEGTFLMGGDATRVPVIPAPPSGTQEQQLGHQTNVHTVRRVTKTQPLSLHLPGMSRPADWRRSSSPDGSGVSDHAAGNSAMGTSQLL